VGWNRQCLRLIFSKIVAQHRIGALLKEVKRRKFRGDQIHGCDRTMVDPNIRSDKAAGRSGPKLELFDPARGDSAFRLQKLTAENLRCPTRMNYFTILWVRRGSGTWHVDSNDYTFRRPALLFANPYQTVFIQSRPDLTGARLLFHANFFCIETHHKEVGCNGVLFNNIYGAPVLRVNNENAAEFERLIALMEDELASASLAHSEILLSYLKVFLIKAARIKVEEQRQFSPRPDASAARPHILAQLVELVEINYQKKHRPSEYAKLLGISEKALNKIVSTHFGKTLTLLIRERILNHAKWRLLHTRQPVKEIADETGFADEFYFSRLFKRATGMAPTAFREFETRIRDGSNLSM
jgi:AraC family transcriptional activator of pobA